VIALKIVGITALSLAMLASLLLIVFGLPGTWIIFILALIAAAIGDFQKITLMVLLVLFGIALLGELMEFLAGYLGARKKGASRWASGSAIIFSFIGAILMSGIPPVIGALIGAFLGAFLGAVLAEYIIQREWRRALEAGAAALFGRMISLISKIAVGVSMIVITIYYLI